MTGLADVLAQAYSLRGPRLTPRPTGVLAQVYSFEGPRLMPGLAVVPGSGPLAPELLPCTCSYGVHCLRSALAQVTGSVLLLQRSLSGSIPTPTPTPVELAFSGLLWLRSLAQSCSHRVCHLRPVLA